MSNETNEIDPKLAEVEEQLADEAARAELEAAIRIDNALRRELAVSKGVEWVEEQSVDEWLRELMTYEDENEL